MGSIASPSPSSRKLASSISSIASRLFFLLIILQLPLFRVPCGCGICTTPLQLTSSQLITAEILPVPFVKALLYPGAVVNALIKGTNIPNSNDLLETYSMSHVKEVSPALHLKQIEVRFPFRQQFKIDRIHLDLGQVSFFGLHHHRFPGMFADVSRELHGSTTVQISPVMLVAVFIALLCIKGDVKQILRSFQAHSSATAATILQEHIRNRRKEREMKRLEWTVNYIGPNTPRNTKVAQVGITNTF